MAGSWRHMTTGSGKLRNNETFTGMIENLGDAYEAAEECYGMTWFLAAWVARLLNPDQEAMSRPYILDIVHQAEAGYQDGLALGGVQRSR